MLVVRVSEVGRPVVMEIFESGKRLKPDQPHSRCFDRFDLVHFFLCERYLFISKWKVGSYLIRVEWISRIIAYKLRFFLKLTISFSFNWLSYFLFL